MQSYMQEPRKSRGFGGPGVGVTGVRSCRARVLTPNVVPLQGQCVLSTVWLLSRP